MMPSRLQIKAALQDERRIRTRLAWFNASMLAVILIIVLALSVEVMTW